MHTKKHSTRSVLLGLVLFLLLCACTLKNQPIDATGTPTVPAATLASNSLLPVPSLVAISTTTPAATHTAQPSPTPMVAPTIIPTPTFTFPLIQPVESQLPGIPKDIKLRIFELGRPIIAGEFGYREVDALLAENGYGGPRDWDGTSGNNEWLARINSALAPFGDHFVPSMTGKDYYNNLTLYQGENRLLEECTLVSGVSVNHSKTDFVMVVEKSLPFPKRYLLRKGSLELLLYSQREQWGKYNEEAWPQFIGDDLIYATMEADPNQIGRIIRVYRNDQPIYQTPGTLDIRPPLYRLWVYQDAAGDHWSVEILNKIVIDGVSVNERNGYQKSYEFNLLGGKPVYLFEKDGRVGLNFHGQEVMLPGNSVPHYGCCYSAMINAGFTDTFLVFFLQDGERWKYVDVSVR